jgi:protein-L-isoaspartate(D-aspartate) O-methyltransferase
MRANFPRGPTGMDFATARVNMVENQVRTNDVTDLPIQDAMRVVAREHFCSPGKAHMAYAEAAVEYAPGYWLMEPRDVAKLLQAVFPKPGERALAIAAPYAAAVLARMGLKVTLRLPDAGAADRLGRALDGLNVVLSTGDLADPGDVAGAPFDVVLSEGAVNTAPPAWKAATAVFGRLAVVERDGPGGKAVLYLRGEDGLLGRREVFDSSPRLLPGFERAPAFSF